MEVIRYKNIQWVDTITAIDDEVTLEKRIAIARGIGFMRRGKSLYNFPAVLRRLALADVRHHVCSPLPLLIFLNLLPSLLPHRM